MKGADKMGFKNRLNKMKSFLFDEEDDVKPIKKSRTKKIVENEEIEKTTDDYVESNEVEDLFFDEEPEVEEQEEIEIKTRVEKNEKEFNFPEFDDDDFMVSKPVEEVKVVQIVEPKEEIKPMLYQGSKRKEETKKFKPSPIISPIYGLLDSDGNTISNEEKKESYFEQEEVSLDSVRKKAYGSLSDELENTMVRLSKKTIEEAERDMEEEEKRLEEEKEYELDNETYVSENKEDDDMLLPNINFKEIDVDLEREKKHKKVEPKEEDEEPVITKEVKEDYDDEDEDTKEQDLFNLIDSMYQKEGNEE